MLRKSMAISAILLTTVLSSSGTAQDNSVGSGAKKVESGFDAMGRSVGEIGSKAGKAVEGAARDTAEAVGKAFDNVVKGVKNISK